jgi:hypothetical protein
VAWRIGVVAGSCFARSLLGVGGGALAVLAVAPLAGWELIDCLIVRRV